MTEKPSKPLKAWRSVWAKLPDEVAIIGAPTRGQAIAKCIAHLATVGWHATWPEMKCSRAKEYDDWANRQPERRLNQCILEEYVRKESQHDRRGPETP